jgi:hypothetical protein
VPSFLDDIEEIASAPLLHGSAGDHGILQRVENQADVEELAGRQSFVGIRHEFGLERMVPVAYRRRCR